MRRAPELGRSDHPGGCLRSSPLRPSSSAGHRQRALRPCARPETWRGRLQCQRYSPLYWLRTGTPFWSRWAIDEDRPCHGDFDIGRDCQRTAAGRAIGEVHLRLVDAGRDGACGCRLAELDVLERGADSVEPDVDGKSSRQAQVSPDDAMDDVEVVGFGCGSELARGLQWRREWMRGVSESFAALLRRRRQAPIWGLTEWVEHDRARRDVNKFLSNNIDNPPKDQLEATIACAKLLDAIR